MDDVEKAFSRIRAAIANNIPTSIRDGVLKDVKIIEDKIDTLEDRIENTKYED